MFWLNAARPFAPPIFSTPRHSKLVSALITHGLRTDTGGETFGHGDRGKKHRGRLIKPYELVSLSVPLAWRRLHPPAVRVKYTEHIPAPSRKLVRIESEKVVHSRRHMQLHPISVEHATAVDQPDSCRARAAQGVRLFPDKPGPTPSCSTIVFQRRERYPEFGLVCILRQQP